MSDENRKTIMLLRMAINQLEEQRKEAFKEMLRCHRDPVAAKRARLEYQDLKATIEDTLRRIRKLEGYAE